MEGEEGEGRVGVVRVVEVVEVVVKGFAAESDLGALLLTEGVIVGVGSGVEETEALVESFLLVEGLVCDDNSEGDEVGGIARAAC